MVDSVHKPTRQTTFAETAPTSTRSGSVAKATRKSKRHSADEDKDKDEKRSVFVDAEQMKARVRSKLHKPTYAVSDFYHKIGLFQAIARNRMFENATLLTIAFNALWIAIDTDNNGADSLVNAQPIFQVVEHSFCLYFSLELFIRFMSFKRKRDTLKDAWFVFDTALVLMMVAETWILTFVLLMLGGGGSSKLGSASILRLIRLLRLSRMARMLRSMPEVLILIKGMVAAFRSVFFTMCLLLALIYIFAIALRQLTDGSVIGSVYFASITASMYTLLMTGTFLENLKSTVDDIARPDTGHPAYACVFLLFVCFSSLMVMNMLIGVLCEVVSAVASTEKEEMTVNFVKGAMQHLMEKMDSNFDNVIDREEFLQILEDPSAVKILYDIGVDPIALVDLADHIFEDKDKNDRLDIDEEDSDSIESGGRSLDFGEFMEMILELRGSNGATVKDIQNLSKTIKVELKRMEERQRSRSRLGMRTRTFTHMSLPDPQDSVTPSPPTTTIPTVHIHQNTDKVEAWLIATQSELRRLRCPDLPGAVDSSQTPDLQTWAANLDDAVTNGLADLQRLQGMSRVGSRGSARVSLSSQAWQE